ncbi:MAG: MarR family winged helix-turn-helix transcriptional regulator [Granulosicoccus sp.]
MGRHKINPISNSIEQVSDETLTNLLGYNIKRASNVIQNDLARSLKPLRLRMITFTALVLIVDNPGIRQSQLAAALSIERPNCVVIIDELELREIITREQVPTDRRAYALKPTPAGLKLYKKALATAQAHEDALFGHFNSKQRNQINAANRLIDSLRKQGLKT